MKKILKISCLFILLFYIISCSNNTNTSIYITINNYSIQNIQGNFIVLNNKILENVNIAKNSTYSTEFDLKDINKLIKEQKTREGNLIFNIDNNKQEIVLFDYLMVGYYHDKGTKININIHEDMTYEVIYKHEKK